MIRHRRRGDAAPLGGRHRDRGRADHARDPGGLPGHRARPQRALGPVARLRHARAGRGLSTGLREIPLARPAPRRAGGGARARGARAPGGSRSGRRSIASRSCWPSGSARPTWPRSRAARPGCTCSARIAGLGPGDEAITSPISFVSSANCFIFEGATPVFADVDPRTLNLDPAAVEAAITERTKAVVAVDMFGYPCELDELRALCSRRGLTLIEDAAEALGAEYKGAPIGSHGPSGVFRLLPEQAAGDRARAASSSRTPSVSGSCVRSLRNQGTRLRRRRVVQPRAARVELPLDRRAGRDRDRAAREARPAAGAAGGGSRAVRGGCSRASRSEPLCADDADHRRSWFVYVVAAAARRRPRPR